MECYALKGKWFVRVEGIGYDPGQEARPEVHGPFVARPEPTTAWHREDYGGPGVTRHRYTLFAVQGEPTFTLHEETFSPEPGCSGSGGGEEILGVLEPAEAEDCYEWVGNGWQEAEPRPLLVCPAHPDERAGSTACDE